MTPEDRKYVHWQKPRGHRADYAKTWTACGKRAALVPSSPDAERVTCPACLTHVRKIEQPG
jgi:predicted nucleic acid-binding Zn ribbon protein